MLSQQQEFPIKHIDLSQGLPKDPEELQILFYLVKNSFSEEGLIKESDHFSTGKLSRKQLYTVKYSIENDERTFNVQINRQVVFLGNGIYAIMPSSANADDQDYILHRRLDEKNLKLKRHQNEYQKQIPRINTNFSCFDPLNSQKLIMQDFFFQRIACKFFPGLSKVFKPIACFKLSHNSTACLTFDMDIICKITSPSLKKSTAYELSCNKLFFNDHSRLGLLTYNLLNHHALNDCSYIMIQPNYGLSLSRHFHLGSISNDFHLQAKIIAAIAKELSEIHGKNLIHGDLKPCNITLQKNSDNSITVKIIDFGNCGLRDSNMLVVPKMGDCLYRYWPISLYLPKTHPFYIEPKLTKELDIYSLGVTIIEILLTSGVIQKNVKLNLDYSTHMFKAMLHVEARTDNPKNTDQIAPFLVQFRKTLIDILPKTEVSQSTISLVLQMISIDATKRPNLETVITHFNQIAASNIEVSKSELPSISHEHKVFTIDSGANFFKVNKIQTKAGTPTTYRPLVKRTLPFFRSSQNKTKEQIPNAAPLIES